MNDWPYPPPVDDGGARHLRPGLRLPDIALEATVGPPINLSKTAGRAVVFVYPYTGVPGQPNPPDWDTIAGAHGSTPEAESFRDSMFAYHARSISVFGLSSQTSEHQRQLAARIGLTYPVLSDVTFVFTGALDLPRFETGGVTYLKRLTLIADDGVIERVIYPVHPPHTHAQDLLLSLGEAKR